MNVKLVLKQKSDQTLILSLGQGFRWFFYSFGLILLGFIVSEGQQEISLVPVVFCLLFLILGSYYEAWIFDLEKGMVERRHGLLFWYRTRSVPVAQLKSVHLFSFTKGGNRRNREVLTGKKKWGLRSKKIRRLYLLNSDDTNLDIEISFDQQQTRLEAMGKAIASFCKLPFIEEREGDQT